jgi:hypothetical protein
VVQLCEIQARSVQNGRQKDDSESDDKRDDGAVMVGWGRGIAILLPAKKVGRYRGKPPCRHS